MLEVEAFKEAFDVIGIDVVRLNCLYIFVIICHW